MSKLQLDEVRIPGAIDGLKHSKGGHTSIIDKALEANRKFPKRYDPTLGRLQG
jgi:hypothetical protein